MSELHETVPISSHCFGGFFCFLVCFCWIQTPPVPWWGGPHLLNAGIHLILPVSDFSLHNAPPAPLQTPKASRRLDWPPIRCTCYGWAWQISTLQIYWTSVDVCLVKTARSFPDLASGRHWYNGTLMRHSSANGFSSDVPVFFWCKRVYPTTIQFNTRIVKLAERPISILTIVKWTVLLFLWGSRVSCVPASFLSCHKH